MIENKELPRDYAEAIKTNSPVVGSNLVVTARGGGKSHQCMVRAHQDGGTVVSMRPRDVVQKASKMNLNIKVISHLELARKIMRSEGMEENVKYHIDDVDAFLNLLLRRLGTIGMLTLNPY